MKFSHKISGIIILAFLIALSLIDVGSQNLPIKWIPFLGRFHPVFLHLPIGLLVGVALLELYIIARPIPRVSVKIELLLITGFYATAISALFGIFLSWEGGYEANALMLHKWGGIATTATVFILVWLQKNRRGDPDKLPVAYLSSLVATFGALSATGHFGGSLTHGSDYLTEFSPFTRDAKVAEITEDSPVFVSHIQPILQDYCVQCHGPEKIKGELRLDTFDMMMSGGLNGPVVVPGNAVESKLVDVIRLPMDEEAHMPPKGKPQPSEEIVQLLSWWIDQGVSSTARIDDLEITSEVAIHFLDIEILELRSREEIDEQVKALGGTNGFNLNFIAQNDNRIRVRLGNASDEKLKDLLPLRSNIYELDLGGSDVSDNGLKLVGRMTNLVRLHLNNTAITDTGIGFLGNLYQLEYVNLYRTGITDESLLVLRRLKNLRNVFLWQTKVTPEAIAELRRSIYPAVRSDRLSMQIDELRRERTNLEVEIISNFDLEKHLDRQEAENESEISEPKITISDVMIKFHKGENSIAVQAQEGRADRDIVRNMMRHYKMISELEPPKGEFEDWKRRMTRLADAAYYLFVTGSEDAIDRYTSAVDCRACHSAHRRD